MITPGSHPNEMYAALIAENSPADVEEMADAFGVETDDIQLASNQLDSLTQTAEFSINREESAREELKKTGIDPEDLESF